MPPIASYSFVFRVVGFIIDDLKIKIKNKIKENENAPLYNRDLPIGSTKHF